MTTHHSPDAEKAVLGTVLLTGTIDACGHITPGDFFVPQHKTVWAAILALASEGKPIDLITVMDKTQGAVDPVTLSHLTDGVPKTTNVTWYADIVRNHSERRKAIHRLQEAVEYLVEGGDDPQMLIEASQSLLPVAASASLGISSTAEDVSASLLDTLESRQAGKVAVVQYSTGKMNLDKYFRYEPGKLYVIAGRPGMGKTALAIDQALHLSRTMPGIIFEQEMSANEVALRMLSLISRLPFAGVRDASQEKPLDTASWERLAAAQANLRDTSMLYINDLPCRSLADIEMEVVRTNTRRAAAGQSKLGFVVFDYIQIADLGDDRNRNTAIGKFTMGLKNLARKHGLIVIALSQLSRPDKKSYDKNGLPPLPRLDDLRDSGSIEQDADTVIFLHRPEYYLKTSGRPVGAWEAVVQVPVSKNRGGETGLTSLGWVGPTMILTDPWWSDDGVGTEFGGGCGDGVEEEGA